MKLKFVAAAAAVLCGANAFAAINTIDGDAEVWAMVWDETIGTYALDLGVTKDALFSGAITGQIGASVIGADGTPTKAWADYIKADTDLTDFKPFEGTRWAVFAIDNEGDPFVQQGAQSVLFSTPSATPPMLSESDVTGSLGGLTFLTGSFGLNTTPSVQGDAFNAAGSAGHFTEAGSLVGRWSAGNKVGLTSNLFNCTDTGGFGFGDAACTASASLVTFDGVKFSVSPIPEPGTYALLLAGLLTVGVVARRRRR
jgi:hypothetical protein